VGGSDGSDVFSVCFQEKLSPDPELEQSNWEALDAPKVSQRLWAVHHSGKPQGSVPNTEKAFHSKLQLRSGKANKSLTKE